jgi:probable F420-dependent oxidoreductase
MAHPRPFRFGVQLSRPWPGRTWTETARAVEDLGYSSLLVPDHFGDQLAPVPALTAAAGATTTLRVGALVWDNDYKHPVVLAKEAATIDVLSEGRLEFGIGAGWMNTDYEQSGIAKDPAGTRIARLEEAIAVFKGLWADGEFSLAGQHYRIEKLDGRPKPVQQPHPPVIIGGGGPRMIGLVARHADIAGMNPPIPKGYVDREVTRQVAPAHVDRRMDLLRREAGARFEDIEINILVYATDLAPGAAGRRDGLARMFSVPPEDLDGSPYVLAGEPEQVADQVRAARDRWGASYYVLQADQAAAEAAAGLVAELSGT